MLSLVGEKIEISLSILKKRFEMKRLWIVVVVLLLIGCVTKMEHPSASLPDQQDVRNFVVEKGLARVHFYLGTAEIYGRKTPMNQAFEIFINNQSAGIVGNKDEFIVADLYPGEYSFLWKILGSNTETPHLLELNITAQDLIFLEANLVHGATLTGAILFGPIVGAVSAANAKISIGFSRTYSAGQKAIKQKKLVFRNTTIKDSLLPLKAKSSQSKIIVSEESTSIQPSKPVENKVKFFEKENKTQLIKPDIHKKLEQLKKLYDDNLITKEDYDKKRKELVDDF